MTPPNVRKPLLQLWGGRAIGWVRHILRDGAPYLDRYSLRKQGPSGHNPWRAYLHAFHAPDQPDHHNHPSKWSFSIVLWGSYTEEIREWEDYVTGEMLPPDPDGLRDGVLRTRRVRWFNFITADKYHRITELHPGPGASAVYTLFFCGPLSGRGWGFWRPGRGHVPVGEGH
jgi:hypothetical protein